MLHLPGGFPPISNRGVASDSPTPKPTSAPVPTTPEDITCGQHAYLHLDPRDPFCPACAGDEDEAPTTSAPVPPPAPCGCTFEGPSGPVPGRILDWCPEAYRLSYQGMEATPRDYSWSAYCSHVDAARAAAQLAARGLPPMAGGSESILHSYVDQTRRPMEAVYQLACGHTIRRPDGALSKGDAVDCEACALAARGLPENMQGMPVAIGESYQRPHRHQCTGANDTGCGAVRDCGPRCSDPRLWYRYCPACEAQYRLAARGLPPIAGGSGETGTYHTRYWTIQRQGSLRLTALSRIWCAVCDRCDERGTVYQNVNVTESSSAHVSVCLDCWAAITGPAAPRLDAILEEPSHADVSPVCETDGLPGPLQLRVPVLPDLPVAAPAPAAAGESLRPDVAPMGGYRPMGGGSEDADRDFHTSTATEWFHCDRCQASVFRGQPYWFFRFAGVIDQLCQPCGDKRRTDIALANVAKAVGATEFHITR